MTETRRSVLGMAPVIIGATFIAPESATASATNSCSLVHGQFDVTNFGVRADGTGEFGAALAAAAAEAACYPGGGTIIVPDGTFAMRSQFVLPRKVSIRASPQALIRCDTEMEAMVTSGVGREHRLDKQVICGGVWQGNGKANRIFWLRDFQDVTVEHLRMEGCNGAYVEAGSKAEERNSYGLYVRRVDIDRKLNSKYPEGNYGFLFAAASDSHIDDCSISGVEIGVVGHIYVSKLSKIHVWGYGPKDGQVHTGFYIQGMNNQLHQCQVDNPSTYAYRFGATRNKLTQSNVTFAIPATDNWLSDNRVVCVHVDGEFEIDVEGCIWNSNNPAYRLAAEFGGNLSRIRAFSNLSNNVVTVLGDRGPSLVQARCTVATSAGAPPLVIGAYNIASVERLADGDYLFAFPRTVSGATYSVVATAEPEDNGRYCVCIIRNQAEDSIRIQCIDSHDKLVRPARIHMIMTQ
jgi:hypothetical protein